MTWKAEKEGGCRRAEQGEESVKVRVRHYLLPFCANIHGASSSGHSQELQALWINAPMFSPTPRINFYQVQNLRKDTPGFTKFKVRHLTEELLGGTER